ncbi:MAG: hypothetical protein PHI63_03770, partial [Patescibacteria group bacterium]|nr:hypothetical protein [Patescibacteria group bacterium]
VGAGRRQLQIFNQYDPCCFSGVRFRQYDTLVAQTVTQLAGGNFSTYLDPAYEHAISPQALQVIAADWERVENF